MADKVPDVDHDKLPQKLTARELETWIPAKRALERMIACGPNHGEATEALWKLLVTGHLRSGAEHHTVEIPRLQNGGVIEIEDTRWRNFGEPWQSALWSTGQASLSIESDGHGYRRDPESLVTYFGVRFEPIALAKTLAGLGEKPQVALQPSVPSDASQDRAGDSAKSRIGDEPLAAWAAVFNKYYPGASLQEAWDSARGMFPDKRVSRERVDALLPKRERGRRKGKIGN
jgi:hypothetical protein